MLELNQPMSSEILAVTHGYTIEPGKQGVNKDSFRYVSMHDRAPTLEQCMEHLIALDPSLNLSQPGSSFSAKINTTTQVSTRKMNS